MDELFTAGAIEPEVAKRKAIFAEMQQIAQADVPALYIIEAARVSVWNKRVHGLLTNGLSFYGGWHRVWKD